jgi:5'-deoxynucleotidase YfbR-like HD superfamily hydrolase
MLSGRRLDLLDPSPLDIEIEDIALGLSRVARWNGQTAGEHGLSVAQHSLLVLDIVEATVREAGPDLRRAALLHDASEFVTADLITPFKRVLGDTYKAVERRVQAAVHLRFGLPAELPAPWTRAIKRADVDAAFFEAVEVAGFTEAEARRIFRFRRGRRAGTLTPWPAETARRSFLERFQLLAP